jgi:hypothetical protein
MLLAVALAVAAAALLTRCLVVSGCGGVVGGAVVGVVVVVVGSQLRLVPLPTLLVEPVATGAGAVAGGGLALLRWSRL